MQYTIIIMMIITVIIDNKLKKYKSAIKTVKTARNTKTKLPSLSTVPVYKMIIIKFIL